MNKDVGSDALLSCLLLDVLTELFEESEVAAVPCLLDGTTHIVFVLACVFLLLATLVLSARSFLPTKQTRLPFVECLLVLLSGTWFRVLLPLVDETAALVCFFFENVQA